MEDLIKRLNSGPKFLFLGQSYLRLEMNEDLFLKQIVKKYGNPEDSADNYDAIFSTKASSNTEEAYAWMLTRCMNIPIPQPLETISLLDWNGIFTSTIDNIFHRSLSSDWRDIQPIFDEHYIPSDPRSKSRLNIWHLFGSLIAPDSSLKPPLNKESYWSFENRAVLLANRIKELITPIGILCIEGYHSEKDWFSTDKFFPIINSLMNEQVHLFSASEEHFRNDRLSHLISNNKLIIHEESLAQFLLRSADSNKLKLGVKPEDIEFGRLIRIGGNQVEIPSSLLKDLATTCTLLTENRYLPFEELSDDRLYLEFKNFLLESSIKPQWEGISRGFAFYRDYEIQLKSTIESLLSHASKRRLPVILKGQTGTGKSVALSHLAFDIQKSGYYPVIYISKSSRRIKRDAIDRFCEWAENSGASASLIIWDGMQPNEEYIELQQYLNIRLTTIINE